MARLEKNSIEEAGINPFNAPIPGESLTTSPDNPKAWERPPEFANSGGLSHALGLSGEVVKDSPGIGALKGFIPASSILFFSNLAIILSSF